MPDISHITVYGQYFSLVETRSRLGYYFFEYINREKEAKKLHVVIEPGEISFKTEAITKTSVEFRDLLVVPLSTNYTSFTLIEAELIQKKKEKVFSTDITFEDVFKHFIIDLYVNHFFKHTGRVPEIKAALEYVPLLQGIIHKTLFYHYYELFISESKCNKWKCNKWNSYYDHFHDQYLCLSRFLSNPSSEKYFLPGGWFIQVKTGKAETSNQNPEYEDIDSFLFLVEKKHESVLASKETETNTQSRTIENQINTRNILKRYGVVHVLRLTLQSQLFVNLFIFSLLTLIVFILTDVAEYNLLRGLVTKSGFATIISKIIYYGYYFSVLLFSILSIIIAIVLWKKHKYKVVPGIFLPRMVIAVISGWVIFLTGEELLKIDINLENWILWLLFVFIVFATLIFMVFEINNYAPAMNWWRVIKRSLVVCGLAFVVSYAFGFWVMTFVNDKFLGMGNVLVDGSAIKEDFRHRKSDIATIYEWNRDTSRSNGFLDYKEENLLPLSSIDSITGEKQIRDSLLSMNTRIVRDSSFQLKKLAAGKSLQLSDSIVRLSSNYIISAYYHYDSLDYLRMFEKYLKEVQKVEIGTKTIYAKNYSLNFLKFESGNGKVVCTFPNMLLARALISMFIGIFFQLIIQDKTITEPI